MAERKRGRGRAVTDTTFTRGEKQEEDPPPACVREPRRPRPKTPAAGMALEEPPVLVGATED